MDDYGELRQTPRPTAKRPMPRQQRAAQFAPFAALSGLEEALGETARLTQRRVPLSEEDAAQLDRTLAAVRERLREEPSVRLLCFEEDATKEGGRYVTVEGTLRAVDDVTGELVLRDGRRVPPSAVCAMTVT